MVSAAAAQFRERAKGVHSNLSKQSGSTKGSSDESSGDEKSFKHSAESSDERKVHPQHVANATTQPENLIEVQSAITSIL